MYGGTKVLIRMRSGFSTARGTLSYLPVDVLEFWVCIMAVLATGKVQVGKHKTRFGSSGCICDVGYTYIALRSEDPHSGVRSGR